MFPTYRNFDPANGFSWADGKADALQGNNNESTSEAATSYGSIILYGLITGNDELVYSKNVYSKKFDEEYGPLYTYRVPVNKKLKKVRLKVISNKKLPKGHPAEGEPAWLFIDEVMLM